jgi:excinuclease UvrABC nuclease subunit
MVIYFLFRENELVYVGKSNRLSSRLRKHKFNGKRFDEYSFQILKPEFEKMIIRTFKPILNIYLKSD